MKYKKTLTTNARDRGQLSSNVRNTYCVLRLKTEPVRAGMDATAEVWLFFLYTVLVAAAVVRVSLANNNKNFLFVYFAEHMIDHLEQF